MKRISRFIFGDMTIDYYQTAESVEWLIIPTSLKKEITLPQKEKYDSLIQAKLVGDDYPKGFSTGSTMRNSQTVKNLQFLAQNLVDSDAAQEVHTHLTDERGNRYTHIVIWKKRSAVLETFVTFENRSIESLTLEMLASFSLSNLSPFHKVNPIGNLDLTRYQSKWSFEGRRTTQLIEELQLEPSWKPSGVGLEKFGQIGSMPVRGWFPYVAVHDRQKNVTWAACVAHPGSWQIEAYRLDEDLCLSGGLADRDYGHWSKQLQPGESFTTPKAYLTVAQADEEQTSQRLSEVLMDAVNERKHPSESELAVQFNEFCTSWGRPTESSVLDNLAALKGKNFQYYVIDAGWYANQDGWERSHGDWQVNRTQFPNGLKPVIEAIKANDMLPGIWFEIETVGDGALASTFFDHLLVKDGYPLTAGSRRFWDMRDPWVLQYLQDRVVDFLKEHQFGYLKIDYNENFGIGFDGEESFGEMGRQQLSASQDFILHLQKQLPDLIIENCSSGGHRLEYSMMQLTDLSSFSDAHEATCIPIIAANLHHLMLPSQCLIWAVIRKQDLIERLYYSMTSTFLGRMCLSGDINELSSDQWSVINECRGFYEECKGLIKEGKTKVFREEILYYRQPKGCQFVVRSQGKRALIVIHNFDQQEVEVPFKIAAIMKTCGVEQQSILLKKTADICRIVFPQHLMGCALLVELASFDRFWHESCFIKSDQ